MNLSDIIEQLGTEEREVLRLTAQRLLDGQRSYGRLAVKYDHRDFNEEIVAEALDILNYTSIQLLRSTVSRKRDTDPAE